MSPPVDLTGGACHLCARPRVREPETRTDARRPTWQSSESHRYTLEPADLEELLARRATLITAIRAAHPGLAETRHAVTVGSAPILIHSEESRR
jgi:hypothetical protein